MIGSCFVCGHNSFKYLFSQKPCMSSDGQIIDLLIDKSECVACGTVCSSDVSFLDNFYKDYYQLNKSNHDPEYLFNGESMPKSKMHYEWIEKLLGNSIGKLNSVMEIGCGSGNLLSLFNIKNKFGIEPSKDACSYASKIANVQNIGYENLSDNETYDLVLSTCVIEHTVDPNHFLKKIWSISSESSIIVIGLPIQDVESFDVYFLDHLHHFTSKQFVYLCQKNGFTVNKFEIGYKCMKTIAYFVLSKNKTSCEKLVYEKNNNFYNSKVWLKNIEEYIELNKAKKIIAFGYGETSFFFQAYSNINSSITYFIDDVKAGVTTNVISIAEATHLDIFNDCVVVMLANPYYHNFIIQKIKKKPQLEFYCPFSNQITVN